MSLIIFLFQMLSLIQISTLGITIFILSQGILGVSIPYLPLWLNITLGLSIIHIVVEAVRNHYLKDNHIIMSVFLITFWLMFINFSDLTIFMIDNTYHLQSITNAATLFIIGVYFYQNLQRSFTFFAKINISSRWIITLSFLIVIALGTALLMLPVSVNPKLPRISIINAFFTAVSAVCVTGLVVLDTATYFSRFGQIVILGLIQIGSLGLVTITTVFINLLGRKLSLTGQLSAKDSISSTSGDNTLIYYLSFTLGFTILVEIMIAVALFLRFVHIFPFREAVFYSIFHAVSSFCNAGFALFSDSLMTFNDDLLINLSIMISIIIGGMGFGVWLDLESKYITKRTKQLKLQSLIALKISGLLIIIGTILFYIFERNHSLINIAFPQQILNSLFASVNLRTAGFNTIDLSQTSEASRLMSMLLMYIGASPGSTGGGIKTTSFMVLYAAIHSSINNNDTITIFGRRIEKDIISQTWTLIFNSTAWIFMVSLMLCYIDNISLSEAAYETVSAFATVGVSTGITPTLQNSSKILIAITMILGRVSPTTIMLALVGKKTKPVLIRTPVEPLSIG